MPGASFLDSPPSSSHDSERGDGTRKSPSNIGVRSADADKGNPPSSGGRITRPLRQAQASSPDPPLVGGGGIFPLPSVQRGHSGKITKEV